MSQSKLKKRIRHIYKDCQESVLIQQGSTEILRLNVSAILDFAQIVSNKFRTESHDFDIKKAVLEIVDVQN